jgi:hypothetical protein
LHQKVNKQLILFTNLHFSSKMLIRFYRREVVKMNAQYFVEHGCKLGIIELNKLIQSESDPIAILNALDAAGYRILRTA